jgi:hypothetical protein
MRRQLIYLPSAGREATPDRSTPVAPNSAIVTRGSFWQRYGHLFPVLLARLPLTSTYTNGPPVWATPGRRRVHE